MLNIRSSIIWGIDKGHISDHSSKKAQSHPIVTTISVKVVIWTMLHKDEDKSQFPYELEVQELATRTVFTTYLAQVSTCSHTTLPLWGGDVAITCCQLLPLPPPPKPIFCLEYFDSFFAPLPK
jgi:hypothetical protein